MKHLLLIILFFMTIPCAGAKSIKRPFSVSALQYLLERKEYKRFDWYIASYLRQHPDTAVLYLLNGYRYFNEALYTRTQKVSYDFDRTGGIPRKYPQHLVSSQSRTNTYIQYIYDEQMLVKAFTAMKKARSLEPSRRDIYLGICRMAAQTEQGAVFFHEIDTMTRIFGWSEEIVSMVLDFMSMKKGGFDSGSVKMLLMKMLAVYPENSEVYTELGKYYFLKGELDSSYLYMLHALFYDAANNTAFKNAITLATIKNDYPAAARLALKKYEISNNPLYLEQAIIYTATFDSAWAHALYKKDTASFYYVDSLSICKWLYTQNQTASPPNSNFYSGELFHLNLPFFELSYKKDNDKNAYYSNKASIFYVYGVYDSAAYYNLNLVRSLQWDDAESISALYNLAAEYYAAGEFTLSYYRFLDLYRFYNKKSDNAVRYALGLNHEIFGDVANAMKHYSYVVHHPDRYYNKTFNLGELASYRLNKLRRSATFALR